MLELLKLQFRGFFVPKIVMAPFIYTSAKLLTSFKGTMHFVTLFSLLEMTGFPGKFLFQLHFYASQALWFGRVREKGAVSVARGTRRSSVPAFMHLLANGTDGPSSRSVFLALK